MARAIRRAEDAHTFQGKRSGLSTGFPDLDCRLGGLRGGELIVIGGRPSMGTTALVTNIALNVASAYREGTDALGQPVVVDGAQVAFFSLETNAEQLVTRMLSVHAETACHKIQQGELSAHELENLTASSLIVERLPIHIDGTSDLTISALRSRTHHLARQQGLGLVIVDYLQLIRAPGSSALDPDQETSEIARGLKSLAQELDVAVIAVLRLSCAVEYRECKRPQLCDLRGSEAIEGADVVIFIFREQYYLERLEPWCSPDEEDDQFFARHDRWRQRCEEVWNTAELIIAIHRNGPIGTVRLSFHSESTKFGNLLSEMP